MGLFRPSRDSAGPHPYTSHKMALFAIGAAIALIGIGTETEWLVTVAIVVLAIGVLLRFLPARKREEGE